jgi:hypothetical protein
LTAEAVLMKCGPSVRIERSLKNVLAREPKQLLGRRFSRPVDPISFSLKWIRRQRHAPRLLILEKVFPINWQSCNESLGENAQLAATIITVIWRFDLDNIFA